MHSGATVCSFWVMSMSMGGMLLIYLKKLCESDNTMEEA